MNQVLDEVLSANAACAARFGEKQAWVRSDVETGSLVEVPAATRIGAATKPRN